MNPRKPISSTDYGMIPPAAKEVEQAVIGAIINYGSLVYDSVSFLRPEMFYDDRYAILFDVLMSMYSSQQKIDILTVNQAMIASGKIEEIGGSYFIAQTCSAVISSANVVEHALIVKQKYVARKTIELCQKTMKEAYDQFSDVGDVMFDLSKEIESLQENLIGQNEIKSLADITESAMHDINRRISQYAAGGQSGVSTGLSDLNRMTSGWQKSDLVIIAARPAMGKTACALHFAKSAAKSGVPVVFFSLEMSDISLYNRLLLCESNIDADSLKLGRLNGDDMQKIDRAARELYNLPIYIDDNANVSMSYIRSKCRLLHRKKKCGMVIIDYLQLASEKGSKNRTREQEITQMSREAKIIAKELEVPVLLLSQLNRAIETRADKKPMLSDLRESGSIEQDADMVMFVHRPGYYGEEVKDRQGNVIKNYGELIIAKYRNGATGKVKFTHSDSLSRIYDFDTRGYAEYSGSRGYDGLTNDMPF